MNKHHLIIIYGIIAASLLIIVYFRGTNTLRTHDEIEALEETVDFATYSAVCTLSESYGEPYVLNEVSREFFEAYSVYTDTTADDLWVYVPAFVFLDTNGFRVGGYDRTAATYEWTPIRRYTHSEGGLDISFTLQDVVTFELADEMVVVNKEDFFSTNKAALPAQIRADIISAEDLLTRAGFTGFTASNYEKLKQSAMATCVSDVVTELINRHNELTRDYGVDFIYSTPAFLDFDTRLPSFMVSFQGYPLTTNGKYYSNLVNRAAFLEEKWH
ncbi:MAG: hypothetical protein MJ124_09120 [Lachnospiraceae bacterium]|nr:hypothetical protein [Lachnospiraceae bacterium]